MYTSPFMFGKRGHLIFYSELWESEFDNIVSKRDKLQDMNINQLKFEVHDTSKKDEKNNEF